MKKSYQSEISAWLFHPNISPVHAMESIVQISVDLFVSGTQYKQSINITFVSVQPAKTFKVLREV